MVMAQILHEIFAFCNSGSAQATAVFILAVGAIVGGTIVGIAAFDALGRFGRRR
jgi:hypothetical protein